MKILVTGATGFVGPRDRPRAARAGARRAGARARPERARTRLASWGVELATGDVTDPASARGGRATAARTSSTSSRSSAAADADFERVMTDGTRNVLAAAREAGVERFVLMSALGTSEATKELVPYWRREVADGAGRRRVGARARDLPPELRLRQGRRRRCRRSSARCGYSPVVTVLGPGTARLAADLGRRRRGATSRARSTSPDAANRTFELGGPEQVSWNELYRRIATRARQAPRASSTSRSRVARTGARLTQSIPRAPLSADQVTMLEAGDNVVTSERRGRRRSACRSSGSTSKSAAWPNCYGAGAGGRSAESRECGLAHGSHHHGRTDARKGAVGGNLGFPRERRGPPRTDGPRSGDQLGLRRGASGRLVVRSSAARMRVPHAG